MNWLITMLPDTSPENVSVAEWLGFPRQDGTGVKLVVGLGEVVEPD
jgi:hypothetical protein